MHAGRNTGAKALRRAPAPRTGRRPTVVNTGSPGGEVALVPVSAAGEGGLECGRRAARKRDVPDIGGWEGGTAGRRARRPAQSWMRTKVTPARRAPYRFRNRSLASLTVSTHAQPPGTAPPPPPRPSLAADRRAGARVPPGSEARARALRPAKRARRPHNASTKSAATLDAKGDPRAQAPRWRRGIFGGLEPTGPSPCTKQGSTLERKFSSPN